MYYRFESGVHPREPTADLLLATSDHSFSLDDHIKYLTKVINNPNWYLFILLAFVNNIIICREYHQLRT